MCRRRRAPSFDAGSLGAFGAVAPTSDLSISTMVLCAPDVSRVPADDLIVIAMTLTQHSRRSYALESSTGC